MIPITGFRQIDNTIDSVLCQKFSECEILILRNDIDIDKIPGKLDILERNNRIAKRNVPIREFLIHKKGKGNALNIGAKHAKHELLCVLDADCILAQNAFSKAFVSFSDDKVMAFGGKLVAKSQRKNCLTFIQEVEYRKTFNVFRSIFNLLNANCLISGAFSIFRKQDFFKVNGYDPDTVGEDMELVLRLQEMLKPTGKRSVYDRTCVCYTEIPCTFLRLLKQRDRWQRGLLDCLIKHRRMIFNPKYDLLGILSLPYQLIIELLGPIFIISQFVIFSFILFQFEPFFKLIEHFEIKQPMCVYGIGFVFETVLTCLAECRERNKLCIGFKTICRALGAVLLGAVLSLPLALTRLYGMISFPWRRLVW